MIRLALPLLLLTGCGLGHLQSARTTPAGTWSTTLGAGWLQNEATRYTPGVPLHVAVRFGLTPRADVGLQPLLGKAALADVKFGLLPPENRLALALRAGVGAGGDAGDDKAFVLHVPLTLLASFDLHEAVTPYAALGYGAWWIHGREPAEPPPPGERYAARRGHGDGVLSAGAGIRLRLGERLSFLAEYLYWLPVVDDPGDFYSFLPSHMVHAGFAF